MEFDSNFSSLTEIVLLCEYCFVKMDAQEDRFLKLDDGDNSVFLQSLVASGPDGAQNTRVQ